MLRRGHSSVHVFLRCQRRLARPSQQCLDSDSRPFGRPCLRCQSTAAALFEHDDTNEESLQPAESPVDVDESIPLRTRNFGSNYVWPIPKTARLGMNALGKPSNIILLNQKDRDIPIVPTELDQETRESLHESLTSESQPLSWDQIRDNINQVRANLGQQRGPLSRHLWTNLQSTLMQGFRRSQLRKFLQESDRLENSSPSRPSRKITSASRKQLIRVIATRIWGYELPLEAFVDPVTSAPGVDQTTKDFTTVVMKVANKRLPAIERYMRTVAEGHQVKLSVSQNEVSLEGNRHQIALAQRSLKELVANVELSRIEREQWLEHVSRLPPNILDNTIASLRQRYGVGIEMKKGKVKATKKNARTKIRSVEVWHQKDQLRGLWQVRRDLRSAAKFVTAKHVDWFALVASKSAGAQNLTLAPSHSKTLMPWNSRGPLYRLIDSRTDNTDLLTAPKHETSRRSEHRPVEDTLKMQPPVSLPPESFSKVRVEYSASYGQVLFNHDGRRERAAFSSVTAGKNFGHSTFVSEPVLVVELLSSPRFQDMGASIYSASGDSLGVTRMVLSPNALDSPWPRIEIIMRGSLSATGQPHSLKILRTSLILEEKTFHVPRPSRAVDIKFTGRTTAHIRDDQPPTEGQKQSLFEALRSYIQLQENLPLFVMLPMPTSSSSKNSPETPKSGHVQSTTTDIEYVQESYDVLRTDARLAPVAQDCTTRLTLEHIIVSGEQSHGQELVLHEGSDKGDSDFAQIFKTAVDVADRLDEVEKQLRRRMMGVK